MAKIFEHYMYKEKNIFGIEKGRKPFLFMFWVRQIRKLVPDHSRLLEVGCGLGFLLRRLEKHYEITGYDYSLKAMSEIKNNIKASLIVGNAQKLTFDKESFPVKKGATSLTEAWDAGPESSQNHFMLGHIMEWFYSDLAGIKATADGPGFKKIIIRPSPVGDLKWARGSLETVRGRIKSEWKIEGGKFRLSVSIPANTTAWIYLPAALGGRVRESGRPAEKSEAIKAIGLVEGRAVFEIGSGRYVFEADWK